MNYAGRSAAVVFLVLLALLVAGCTSTENPQGWAKPATSGSEVYFLSSKDHLSSITVRDDNTASTNWIFPDKNRADQKDLKAKAIYGAPVIDGDVMFLGTYGGEAYAVNRTDGSLKWRRTGLSGSLIGGPALAGDLLAFGTADGKLYVVNKSDGNAAPGWPKDGKSVAGGVWAQPVFGDGAVYAATMEGRVYGFKLSDSSPLWAKPFTVSGAIAEMSALDGGHLFVPSLNKQVYIVDTATGDAPKGGFKASDWVWTRAAYDPKENVAYFGDFSGRIYALDITTNQARWQAETGQRIKSAPAIVDNTLVVVDRKPLVHFLDRATGANRNIVPLLDAGTVRADASVSADGKSAIIATTNGKLFRADPSATSITAIVVGAK